jgi:hypothetical protein
MTEPIRIPVDRLRQVCDQLLTHLAHQEGGTVELERDYFWSLDDESLYNVYSEPGQPVIGQVSESWQHLDQLLQQPDDTPTRHLVWLADVLRAIGTPTTRKPLI